jgi:hypothetical protein
MYVSTDVRIRGYFSKPNAVREQKSLGNTGPVLEINLLLLLILIHYT